MDITEAIFVFALIVDTVLAAVFVAFTIKQVRRNYLARATV